MTQSFLTTDEQTLIDLLETQWSIECIDCGSVDESQSTSTIASVKQFYKDGWRSMEHGAICSECRKEQS